MNQVIGQPLETRLENWKSQLIDLSLRNRLLNLKETRPRSLHILGPEPQAVFDQVAKKGKPVTIFGTSEMSPALTKIPGLEDEPIKPGKGEVLVDMEGTELKNALVRLKLSARSASQEQGLDILFLAFGLLHWRTSVDGDEKARGPLILVPVELRRGTCFDPYLIVPRDDEPVLNPTLAYKLRTEFDLELPPIPEDAASIDLLDYYRQVDEAVQGMAGWKVSEEVVLGLFSFTKMGMYTDLESAGDLALAHPLIRALGGDQSMVAELVPTSPPADILDDTVLPQDTFQILDADSSQQEAILAAKRGMSFVLQGPPGTGKSQTIANIISECISSGKTVLFVSEKMAALEVVKRRLDDRGLGDHILELHSNKTSKTVVIDELSRTAHEAAAEAGNESDLFRLKEVRDRINDYVRALHRPWGALGITPFLAHGEAARLSTAPDLSFPLPSVLELDAKRYSDLLSLMRRATSMGDALLSPDKHPWRDCTLSNWEFGAVTDITQGMQRLRSVATRFSDSFSQARRLTGMEEPTTIQEALAKMEVMRLAVQAPSPREEWWDEKYIEELVLKAEEGRAARHEHRLGIERTLVRYRKEVLSLDVEGMLQRLEESHGSLLRSLRPAYRKDLAILREYSITGEKISYQDAVSDLHLIQHMVLMERKIDEMDQEMGRRFGGHFRGDDTEWSSLQSSLLWTQEFLHRYRAEVNPTLVRLMCGGSAALDPLRDLIPELEMATTELEKAARSLTKYFDQGLVLKGGSTIGSVKVEELSTWAKDHLKSVDRLHQWIDIQTLRAECTRAGLDTFLLAAKESGVLPEEMEPAFNKRFYHLWLDAVYSQDPTLRGFDSGRHMESVREFRKLDKKQLEGAGPRISVRLNEKKRKAMEEIPGDKKSQAYILRREMAKKRAHKPIRLLFSEIPELLLTIKPCLLMSPISVSQYLDPHRIRFDLVIFDEASQIRPEDAVGAIMRAKQVIVVGDSKQLPPTAFFSQVEEEDYSADLESILDECATVGIPQKMLLWHYRSKDESLIAFSNHHFYDGRLSTFPSASGGRESGITFVHVPDGIYERGGSRRNVKEAQTVAELVLEHFARDPDRSLGVVAFSEAQQMAILEEIETLRKGRPDLEPCFDESRHEAFFVKNLENVQGDERDVMLFSVGYGKDAEGGVNLNFGPLNSTGGQRRLNVAITRARYHIKLVSSILPQDIDLSRTRSEGIRLLREYMEFARRGGDREVLMPKEVEPCALVEDIYDRLMAKGLEVRKGVGCSSYRIDLAVIDARTKGYVLGIECDGPMYRSARTARDRDRLRQEILEKLGWRLHRVWSRDWVEDPEREVRKILKMVEVVDTKTPKEVAIPHPVPCSTVSSLVPGPCASVSQDDVEIADYRIRGSGEGTRVRAYAKLQRNDLEDLVKKYRTNPTGVEREVLIRTVNAEGPIHKIGAVRRLAEFYSMLKKTKGSELGLVDAAVRVRAVIDDASKRGQITVKGEFLWPAGLDVPVVRLVPSGERPRDIGEIAPEEVEQAVLSCMETDGAATVGAVVEIASKTLGQDPWEERVRSRVEAAVMRLVEEGKLEIEERRISLADGSRTQEGTEA